MQEAGNNIDSVIGAAIERLRGAIMDAPKVSINGKVSQVLGLVVEGHCPAVSLGELCDIYPRDGLRPVKAEVVGFREDRVLLMPFGEMAGISPGSLIVTGTKKADIKVGEEYLGRVIDGHGNPIDNGGEIRSNFSLPIYSEPVNPLKRKRITEPLDLGVRAVNGLLTMGKGQRMGIMAGSGVGKSVLLGMLARKTSAEVNVIALIGERGREVREFIERDLGEEGLKRSVVIVATSDESPLVRIRGAFIASTFAEYFRGKGKDVLLMMDSVTRFAMAQREVGLAVGEPPTTKGYPPSVFALLPKLLERAGNASGEGSITGLYTVLAEGDDINDPVVDSVRSIVDGHIVLSSELAARGHYPAIDVLRSASRVMTDVVNKDQVAAARELKEVLATYGEAEDLINIGAYVSGSNPKIDRAINLIEKINNFLRQDVEETTSMEESVNMIKAILAGGKTDA